MGEIIPEKGRYPMTSVEMWQRFCRASGVDPNTPYEAWKFCGGLEFDENGLCIPEEFRVVYK